MGAAPSSERKQRVIAARATQCSSAAAIAETAAPSGKAASSKVQKPRRNTSKTKLGLYHVSRRVDARPASLPERERLLVLLRPGPLPTPDAGKALIHTQVLAPASLESQSRAG